MMSFDIFLYETKQPTNGYRRWERRVGVEYMIYFIYYFPF